MLLLNSQRHQWDGLSKSCGDVWQDAYRDRRTDEYCVSAPLILVPEFLCNLIIPPGPWTLNCIKLFQGGGGVPPLFCCVWKMTQMDTNCLSLRRFPLIALLASPNASKPALLHSPLTVTGWMVRNFLLGFQTPSEKKCPYCLLLSIEPGSVSTTSHVDLDLKL